MAIFIVSFSNHALGNVQSEKVLSQTFSEWVFRKNVYMLGSASLITKLLYWNYQTFAVWELMNVFKHRECLYVHIQFYIILWHMWIYIIYWTMTPLNRCRFSEKFYFLSDKILKYNSLHRYKGESVNRSQMEVKQL
jgi:hypothetical protein